MKEIEIDCLGDMCPIPILKIKAALKTAQIGDTIKVVTDHSCVHQSILDHYKKANLQVEETEVINGVWEILLTKLS